MIEYLGQTEHGKMSPWKATLPSDINVQLKSAVALSCIH